MKSCAATAATAVSEVKSSRNPVSQPDKAAHREEIGHQRQMARSGRGAGQAVQIAAAETVTDQNRRRGGYAHHRHKGEIAERNDDLVRGQLDRSDPSHHDRRQREGRHLEHHLHRYGQTHRQQLPNPPPTLRRPCEKTQVTSERNVAQKIGQHHQRHADPRDQRRQTGAAAPISGNPHLP